MTKQISQGSKKGFTLIELSIVLVIIGLIVGGVLVGQDLIKAAEMRATVSQIEKYNTAVNVFRLKYNGIPGDLSGAASYFTLTATAGTIGSNGMGDGDGLVEGISATTPTVCTTLCVAGESVIFWNQLSQSGLISDGVTSSDIGVVAFAAINDTVVPGSKMGKGSRIVVMAVNGTNYFGLLNISGAIAAGVPATFTAAMTPFEAMQFDSKMDDGKPATGIVVSVADVTVPTLGTAANGAAVPAGGDCYDTDAPAAYAGGTVGATSGCSLSVRTSF